MDSISYVYIFWTVHGIWMIYIPFERRYKFSNTIARVLAYRTAVQQRQLRAKWLLCSTRIFAFVSSLKLSRRLLCSVRFVFVSTFNLKRGRTFIVGITNHQFEQIGCLCKGKSSGRPRVSEENVRRVQEFKSGLSVAHASESVERAENFEYRNQLSGVCWGAVYCSNVSIFLNHCVY